ncbi:MAG: cell division ATP-binding protein FtsE [Candidatus Campbellbacteria bacterium]|nr:cell division ATP-binding protein FtsE [Candidatus Campbellbacteria bacterium]
MIIFDNVTKIYGNGVPAIEKVAFGVEPGEFVSIVGHSGAGKSTLVKLLLAEEMPSEGTVLFDKVDIHNLRKRDINLLRRRLGVVFQDFRLLPHKTVFENVAFAMEVSERTDSEIESDVPYALELVGLENKEENFPNELSGGEAQRLAIARAIVTQPDVLIADEPTGNLDPVNIHDIIRILEKINSLGTTILLTTHNKGVVDSLDQRVITMENGRIVRDDRKGRYII